MVLNLVDLNYNNQNTQMTKQTIKITRDDATMLISPPLPTVKKFLTLTYREMVKEFNPKSRRQVTKFKNLVEPMWREATPVDGTESIISYQGFWRSLQEHLLAEGHSVEMHDVREDLLPKPNLKAACLGLRGLQKVWILRALLDGNSGLLGAPTRFGKTYGMTALCKAFPEETTVVTAPGVDLCKQLHAHFKEMLPSREVLGVYTGSNNSRQSKGGITVCSADSLQKMDPDITGLMLLDEPHALVSTKRIPKVAAFYRSRKYGFGATLKGRFDKKDRLIEGLIGPIIANVTYEEAVDAGMISPLKVLMVKVPFSKDTVPGQRVDRATVYKRLLTQSSKMAKIVTEILANHIPDNWQTMAFIQDEKQANYYMENAFPSSGTIAMAKLLSNKARHELTEGIANGDYWRVLASNIYVQGVTFPDLKVVINLAGGGANTTAIQKPGRLLQTRPHKNYGVMIDIVFECTDQKEDSRKNPPYAGVVGECWARHKAYVDIGYDVIFIDDLAEIRPIVDGSYETPAVVDV